MPRQIVRLVLAVLLVASLLGGRSLVANVADGAQHVVKPGETLGAIALQHGVSVDQLVSLNGLEDPDRLFEGQVLKLPAAPARAASPAPAGAGAPAAAPAAPAAAPAEYVVQAGDTLSGIAKALGVSLKTLLEANELADPNRLTVGQKLVVPAGAQAPRAASGPASTGSSVPTYGAAQNGSQPQASGPAQPAAPDEAGALLDRLAQQYGVDRALVRALAWVETDGKARPLDSPGGLGFLAVTERTFEYVAQALVKRPLDRAVPADNVEAGVAYLAAMLKWGGEEVKGLAGFIQGPGSVTANGVRPATEQQVQRVLALRDRLKQGGGTQAVPPAAGTAAAGRARVAADARQTPAEQTATLAARVIGAARAVAGPTARIGVSARNLVTGQRLAIAADEPFPAASVGKLGLLVEAYRQSHSGQLNLTDAQRADVRSMIVASDNDAANRLLELLGSRAVNANLQALGLVGTRLVNPFGLARAQASPANVTTPSDMSRLMELLAAEQLVSAQASREMRALLLQSQDGSKLKRGLPDEARAAHKSGWYDGVANDVGIVTHGDKSYVVAVFTEGIPDHETANQTIAAVARTLHAAWGPAR